MATTTNYGWTTPDDTALVKDGAAAIRTLGSSVDTTTKNLNPETTLGDIAYRSSTANVNTRLGLGTAGQVLQVNSGANAPEWASLVTTPASASARVETGQETSSETYTDLTTAGPAVTLTTGTKVLIIVSSQIYGTGANQYGLMGFAISGATTRAASDSTAVGFAGSDAYADEQSASRASRITVTAGSNTFTAKYRESGSNAAGFASREICVIDLGS